jgi:hypothetical protein
VVHREGLEGLGAGIKQALDLHREGLEADLVRKMKISVMMKLTVLVVNPEVLVIKLAALVVNLEVSAARTINHSRVSQAEVSVVLITPHDRASRVEAEVASARIL